MSNGGYTADPEAMAGAQVRLSEAVEEPAAVATKVAPTQLTAEQFGRIHSEHFQGYSAGIEQIGAALQGLSAELGSLAGGIGAAGRSYTAAEGSTGTTVTRQGGQL
ncbi:hypothetical protein [Qaidamihabitans albus]|uniref:hypothetical protein n=1 Tax=Qaidamihabitans albus TaxID=2795733 RepID=UPI001F2DB418|nr:hypothetical protein [Qaidamihabitans albus]